MVTMGYIRIKCPDTGYSWYILLLQQIYSFDDVTTAAAVQYQYIQSHCSLSSWHALQPDTAIVGSEPLYLCVLRALSLPFIVAECSL